MKRALLLAIVLIVALGAGVTWYVYQMISGGAEPHLVTLQGLHGPVRLIRDRWGIPHIYANDRLDLMRALGYAQASDRLFQIEVRRRLALGRMAEVFGPTLVESDFAHRLVDTAGVGAKTVASYPPEVRAELDAFADGINAYIDRHQGRLSLSFRLAGMVPEHVSSADLEAAAQAFALQFDHNLGEETLYLDVALTMSSGAIAPLMPVYPDVGFELPPPATSALFAANAKLTLNLMPAVAQLGHSAISASEVWAVDGVRSRSGKPMLADDPHLPPDIPSIWYEAVLSTPEGFCAGAMIAGWPGLAIGTNGYVAWGISSANADVVDLSIERLSPERRRFFRAGKWQPLGSREVTIDVKDAPSITRVISQTDRGPLVGDLLSSPGNTLSGVPLTADYAVSMRYAGAAPGGALWAQVLAAHARDGHEIIDAYSHYAGVPLNLGWVDSAGNIGWHVIGAIPKRADFTGKYPTPGFAPGFSWQGTIPYDQLPHAENPPDHYLVLANDRIASAPYNASWSGPWRHDRVTALLSGRFKLSIGDFSAAQSDVVSLFGLKVAHALSAAGDGGDADIGWALDKLKGWDGSMRAASVAPTLIAATEVKLAARVFSRPLGDQYDAFLALQDGGGYSALEDLFARPDSPLWPAGSNGPDRPGTLRDSLKDAMGMLEALLGSNRAKWTWGRQTSLEFKHLVGKEGWRAWLFNRGPISIGGGRETINAGWFDLRDPFAVRRISSYRFVVDMAHPKRAIAINHMGESEHPLSRHYADMLKPWSSGSYHDLSPALEEISGRAESEVDFAPR